MRGLLDVRRVRHAVGVRHIDLTGTPRSMAGSAFALLRRLWAAPLEWRFFAFSVVVLVSGALIIGGWTAREIRSRVIHQAATTNALYVDSFVSPLVQSLDEDGALDAPSVVSLDALLTDTALGEEIVSFKIWAPSGQVLYSTDERLTGTRFPVGTSLARAFEGEVAVEVSSLDADENLFERDNWDALLETYAPVRSHETGRVIAVSEFYQRPDEILSQAGSSQRTGWMIVAAATLGMFVVLNGMVRQASATIRKQNDGLRRLTQQVRTASASKAQTEEQVLARIAQELHDAPAQNLAAALLRLEEIGAEQENRSDDWELVRESVDAALGELRSISSGMRIPEIDQMSAASLVERAAVEFTRRTGRAASLELMLGDTQLPPAANVALYRIVQEALNNAHLHAQATRLSVRAVRVAGWLQVEVLDDGTGFDPAVAAAGAGRAHLGVRGMRERAELLGGSFEVRSRPGAGTRVVARIPLEGTETR